MGWTVPKIQDIDRMELWGLYWEAHRHYCEVYEDLANHDLGCRACRTSGRTGIGKPCQAGAKLQRTYDRRKARMQAMESEIAKRKREGRAFYGQIHR